MCSITTCFSAPLRGSQGGRGEDMLVPISSQASVGFDERDLERWGVMNGALCVHTKEFLAMCNDDGGLESAEEVERVMVAIDRVVMKSKPARWVSSLRDEEAEGIEAGKWNAIVDRQAENRAARLLFSLGESEAEKLENGEWFAAPCSTAGIGCDAMSPLSGNIASRWIAMLGEDEAQGIESDQWGSDVAAPMLSPALHISLLPLSPRYRAEDPRCPRGGCTPSREEDSAAGSGVCIVDHGD